MPTLIKAAAAYMGVAEPTTAAAKQQMGNDFVKQWLHDQIYVSQKSQDAGVDAATKAKAEVWP